MSGVDIGGAEAVTMRNARIEEGVSVVVHRVSAHDHLVSSVAIRVAHTNLVEGRTTGWLVEELLKLTCST